MRSCDIGLITSGTATLEAALLGLPHVVCYKTSRMTYAFARLLVQSKWIALPNILLQQSAVPEHIQDQCTPEALRHAALALNDGNALTSPAARQLKRFKALEQSLRSGQTASRQVADSILTKA